MNDTLTKADCTLRRAWSVLFLMFGVYLCSIPLSAQTSGAGTRAYTFLEQSSSARSTALGDADIAHDYKSSSIVFNNPALLSYEMHRQASLNYQFFYAGIQKGSISYSHGFGDSSLVFNAGMLYSDYGDIAGRDVYNNELETFSGLDLGIHLASSYQLYENMRLGASMRFINSSYETYGSTAMAFDLGAYYSKPQSRMGISLVAKHMGWQFDPFGIEKESLPFNMELGLSTRLQHLPVRFQFLYHHLNRWNLYRQDPTDPENPTTIFTDPNPDGKAAIFFDNLLRHLALSVELALGSKEQVYLRASYNRQVNRELRLIEARSAAGFALGFGINLDRINLDYAFKIFHQVGGVHHMGLGINIVPKKKEHLLD